MLRASELIARRGWAGRVRTLSGHPTLADRGGAGCRPRRWRQPFSPPAAAPSPFASRIPASPGEHAVMEPVILDVGVAGAELAQLVHEERQLSAVRRRLHEQIDNGFPNDVILRREREVSDRRRALHRRIDALRTSLTATVPSPAV